MSRRLGIGVCALAYVASCGPAGGHLTQSTPRGPLVTGPLHAEEQLCEIHGVETWEDGRVLISACSGLVVIDAETTTSYDDCPGDEGPIIRYSPNEALLGSTVCELHGGGVRTLHRRGYRSVAVPPEFAAYVEFEGNELRIIGPGSERTLTLPATVDQVVTSRDSRTVAMRTFPRDDTVHVSRGGPTPTVVHLRLPTIDGPIPHVPNRLALTNIAWQVNSVLVGFSGGLSVFRLPSLGNPITWSGLQQEPHATLSPDGEWVFFADHGTTYCYSTRDGSQRWRSSHSFNDELMEDSRWTTDGSSIVVRNTSHAIRFHAASGDPMERAFLPPGSTAAIASDGHAVAVCRSTLPGHDDELQIHDLRYEEAALWQGIPARSERTRPYRPYPFSQISLPDGSCVLAKVRWLDHDTVAVFNNRLHLIRGGREILSLAVSRSDSGVRAQRDDGPFQSVQTLPVRD